MPAYAYYLARGRERKDPKAANSWNQKSEQALNSLFELFDHPLIKEIAVRKEAISPRFPSVDLRQSNWRIATTIEHDRFARPELKRILDHLKDRGTIVMPSIGHLKTNHKLLRRLCSLPFAPISIEQVKVKAALLKRALTNLPNGRPTDEFEEHVCSFFAWLTQSALNNQRKLETARVRFPKALQPAIRPKRSSMKPKTQRAKTAGTKAKEGRAAV